ncbi:hypothetical protein PBN151_3092 [Paenibacillus sp. NAIST15-1]|nr:hypothetical protein PBN151_3092 [Paenibacillus sp. NAIST15-1]
MVKKLLAVALATVMIVSVSSTALAYGDGRGNGKDLPGGNPPPDPNYCPWGIHAPCYALD